MILDGKSTNADFDIAQIQTPQEVNEDAFSGRLDLKLNNRWSSYVRVFRDRGTSNQPNNVAGQVILTTADPTNAVFNLQAIVSDRTTNEFKFGYNAAKTNLVGLAPTVNGIDFSGFILNLSGSVANNGIAGQGSTSGITVPGGLIRANSAQNGRAQPYDPYTLSFIDSVSSVRGNHYLKAGGELRMIRMTTDRLGGITYAFTNLTAFLANQPSTIQYLGDESAPSVFNNGATGPRHLQEQFYIGYAQDEWHASPKLTLNYGLRYDYYTPMKEANNLEVKFNIDHLRSLRQDHHPRRLRAVRRSGPVGGSDPAGRRLRPRQHDAIDRGAGVPARHQPRGRQLREQPEQPVVPAAGVRERLPGA